MGFWDVIDCVVGYIFVIGIVKDIIEVGIEEVQGYYVEVKEKLFEVGVGLVSDMVIVVIFGIGVEVVIVGKMVVEEVMK